MKKPIVLILATLIGVSAFAQKTTVKGVVLDSLTRVGEPAAILQLFASGDTEKPVAFPTTDNDGFFSIDLTLKGDYCAYFDIMGRKTVRRCFTTAFKQYAFESYEVSALDFLLKPIRYQKFLEAAEKAREWFTMKENAAQIPERTAVFIKVDGAMRRIPLDEILYVEGMKDYVLFFLASARGPLTTHMTMKAAEELLPADRFMRIHRSRIVALSHIDSFTPQGDLQVGSALLHVSDAYREAFDKYLKALQ